MIHATVSPNGLPPVMSVCCDCPRVEDFRHADGPMGDEVAEQCSVWLIPARPLGRTDEIGLWNWRRGEQIIVDIRDQGDTVTDRTLSCVGSVSG